MSVTWGYMMPRREPSAEFTRMANQQKFDQECWDAAKAELETTATSGMDFIHRVAQRAQDIKAERIARHGRLTVEEVMERIHKGLQK